MYNRAYERNLPNLSEQKRRSFFMNKKFEKLGFYPADILLPKDQDMRKWAVVACDQFTSEPEYWIFR